jgi:hypothetical protein
MATARDIMTGDVACVRSSDTVLDAGRTMLARSTTRRSESS